MKADIKREYFKAGGLYTGESVMSDLPTAGEAQAITNDKIQDRSAKVFVRIAEAVNAAAVNGEYEAHVELTSDEVPAVHRVYAILVEMGYLVNYSEPSFSTQYDKHIPASLTFNWDPAKIGVL